jgi:hypothetical protein
MSFDLIATGCVGAEINGPEHKIDAARLSGYDCDSKIVLVRIDDSRVPEFWLTIAIPMLIVSQFVKTSKKPSFAGLKANGRIFGADHKVNSPGNAVYGARLTSYDKTANEVRVNVSDDRAPGFWLAFGIPLAKFQAFVEANE